MLGIVLLINGLFDQLKGAAAGQSSNSNFRKSSKTSLEYATSTFTDTDKMTDKFESTNRTAKFQVGLSSGESLDSLNNLRDDDPHPQQSQQQQQQNKNNADKNKASEQTSKRRVVTHRKKRHKTDKDKNSGICYNSIFKTILKIFRNILCIRHISNNSWNNYSLLKPYADNFDGG